VYLVLDDLGRSRRVRREADTETADLDTVIQVLLAGQYKSSDRVVAFNTVEGWSQDVSADIAQELQTCDVPFFVQDFVDRYEGRHRGIQLPLPMRLL
jgi:hypothetical protein